MLPLATSVFRKPTPLSGDLSVSNSVFYLLPYLENAPAILVSEVILFRELFLSVQTLLCPYILSLGHRPQPCQVRIQWAEWRRRKPSVY